MGCELDGPRLPFTLKSERFSECNGNYLRDNLRVEGRLRVFSRDARGWDD